MPYKNPEDKKAWVKANKEKILATKKAYRERSKEKIKAYVKAWQKANKEKMKAYYEVNKEKIKANGKNWRKTNRERVKTSNKDYYESNRGAFCARVKVYKEKKRQNNLITTKEDKQLAKWIYTMSAKLTETTDIVWHVDHIKPLSKGGMHSLNNLQIVPATWNLQKNNNNEERWNGKD